MSVGLYAYKDFGARIERRQRCDDCGCLRVVSEDEDVSGFAVLRRGPDGSVARWESTCRSCVEEIDRVIREAATRTEWVDRPKGWKVRKAPFARWLRAYMKATGLTIPQLEKELRTPERMIRTIFSNLYESVEVDTVSRALTSAGYLVNVGGRLVVTIDDLYDARELDLALGAKAA